MSWAPLVRSCTFDQYFKSILPKNNSCCKKNIFFLQFWTNVHIFFGPAISVFVQGNFNNFFERKWAKIKTRICVLSIPRKFGTMSIGTFCQKPFQFHYFDIIFFFTWIKKKKLNCNWYIYVFNLPSQRVDKKLAKHCAALESPTLINEFPLRGHIIIAGFL